jgi:hypothetical protein
MDKRLREILLPEKNVVVVNVFLIDYKYRTAFVFEYVAKLQLFIE